jgi:hypothetical protein
MGVAKMADTSNLMTQLVFPRNVSGYGSVGEYTNTARNLRAELWQRAPLGPWGFFGTVAPVGRVANSTDPNNGKLVDFSGNVIADPWLHDQVTCGDINEKHFLFDRISDLVTTRSDTFLAYILVQSIDTGQQRRLVVILDRSRCNKPPGSSDYVAPQVVAHNLTTW